MLTADEQRRLLLASALDYATVVRWRAEGRCDHEAVDRAGAKHAAIALAYAAAVDREAGHELPVD